MDLTIYDTTLRDGMQGEKVNFSLQDKIEVALKLDSLGIHYIEGGFPLSNKKEENFFKQIKRENIKQAKIASFGSTRRPGGNTASDLHINALLQAETEVVTLVGKSWDRHVTGVLGTTLDENLRMIEDSVTYLKKQGREVIYDAEHFFDGYKGHPTYALKTISVARAAGADVVVLCDTNGGSIHTRIVEAIQAVNTIKGMRFGIHLHNDVGMAVANSLIALDYGCVQIQGTINGWGERCGNANLCTLIPNLHFKINPHLFTDEQLKQLTSTAKYISELANIIPGDRDPYVGLSAFAHKAGQHADVIIKNPFLMEHLDSSQVGNDRRILLSELAGKSTIVHKLKKYGSFDKQSPEIKDIIKTLKEKESFGYEYEAAEASFELLVLRIIGRYRKLFELLHYEVESFQSGGGEMIKTLARVRVKISTREYAGAAVDKGPVSALDHALRDAIRLSFPFVDAIKLVDYKVRVLNGEKGVGAKVRVFIKSTDGKTEWDTVGVSENIIEASWQAVVDSLEYVFNNIST